MVYILNFDEERGIYAERVSVAPQEPPTIKIVRRKDDPGWIYFIQQEVSLLIKIGIARNAWTRMKNLQVGSPERLKMLGSFRGTGQTEADLHAEFADLYVAGEWFRPDERLLKRIEELKTPPLLGMHMAKRGAAKIFSKDPALKRTPYQK